jgi:hypothetical protein
MAPRFILSAFDITMALIGAALLAAVLVLTRVYAVDAGDLLTRNSVRLSLAWYTAALCQMMFLGPDDWRAGTTRGRLARWCWTWALGCFLVHLALAFHYFHHWSHAHALEHTREVSGVGEGIFASYLFGLLWAADTTYWWARPAGYSVRGPWIDRSLHAFMLFIIFNGAIVYEAGPIRWAGCLMYLTLAGVWLVARGRRQMFARENAANCSES